MQFNKFLLLKFKESFWKILKKGPLKIYLYSTLPPFWVMLNYDGDQIGIVCIASYLHLGWLFKSAPSRKPDCLFLPNFKWRSYASNAKILSIPLNSIECQFFKLDAVMVCAERDSNFLSNMEMLICEKRIYFCTAQT